MPIITALKRKANGRGHDMEIPLTWFKTGHYRLDEDGNPEKRCSKCREYMPADSEFFYRGKNDDGLYRWCRFCCNEYTARRRAELKRNGR